MILTCPSCATQYAVKDDAIPEGGRKVRCATCGHSWHQQPEAHPPVEVETGEDSVPVAEPAPAPGDADAPDSDGERSPDEPEPVGYEVTDPEAPGGELVDPPTAVPVPPPNGWHEAGDEEQWDPDKELADAEEIAAVESETGDDRERNWVMAILIAIGLVVVIALAFWLLAPDSLRQRVGFAAAAPSPLQIAPGTPERQRLASGNELVVVSGRVINPSSTPQQVPPIDAELRDGSGRLIHSWTIAPPARVLGPGESRTFNSAEMGVPASGADSTVTLTLRG